MSNEVLEVTPERVEEAYKAAYSKHDLGLSAAVMSTLFAVFSAEALLNGAEAGYKFGRPTAALLAGSSLALGYVATNLIPEYVEVRQEADNLARELPDSRTVPGFDLR